MIRVTTAAAEFPEAAVNRQDFLSVETRTASGHCGAIYEEAPVHMSNAISCRPFVMLADRQVRRGMGASCGEGSVKRAPVEGAFGKDDKVNLPGAMYKENRGALSDAKKVAGVSKGARKACGACAAPCAGARSLVLMMLA